jgi:hypothetical protein
MVATSITGAIWYLKGKPDVLKNVIATAETSAERVTMAFVGQDKRSPFEPDRVVIETTDGSLIEARDNPQASFDGQQLNTPWDDIHVAYFIGEALWTYLNTPFIYARGDFSTEETSPIDVDGETWRRLKVTFPGTVKSHTREQISCFGSDGLLRRHDYTVDILQGGTGLNYATDYQDVDGIIVPAQRRPARQRHRLPLHRRGPRQRQAERPPEPPPAPGYHRNPPSQRPRQHTHDASATASSP